MRRKLGELGYVGARTITVEYRWSDDPARLVAQVAELMALKAEAVVTADLSTTRAAKQATHDIPIVAAVLEDDPVAAGLVASLARPGGNITGWSILAPEMGAKRLEVLREIMPDLSRVAVLWTNRADVAEQLRETDRAARALGIAIVRIEVNAPEDIEKAFQAIVQEHAEAVAVLTAPQFVPMSERIAAFGLKHRLPTIAGLDGFVQLGGLVTYGPSVYEGWREAAIFVDKILRGEKTADMPIRQPTKFELLINLKTAKVLGITIPPTFLARADEVIE